MCYVPSGRRRRPPNFHHLQLALLLVYKSLFGRNALHLSFHLTIDAMLPYLVGWRNAPRMFTAIPRRRIIPRDIARRMKGDISRRGVKAVAVVRKVVVLVLVSLEAGVLRQQALDGGGKEGGGAGVNTVPAIGEPFSASHLQEVTRHSIQIFPQIQLAMKT